MSKTTTVKLTDDEIEMLVDALEVDLEGYVDAAKEARANNKRDDVNTFTEAAPTRGTLYRMTVRVTNGFGAQGASARTVACCVSSTPAAFVGTIW